MKAAGPARRSPADVDSARLALTAVLPPVTYRAVGGGHGRPHRGLPARPRAARGARAPARRAGRAAVRRARLRRAPPMDELARRAGVTKPVVYELFGTKDGLFRACLERSAERLAEVVAEAVRAETRAGGALRAGGLAFLRFAADHRVAWELMMEGRFSDAAEVRRRQAALVHRAAAERRRGAWTRASSSCRPRGQLRLRGRGPLDVGAPRGPARAAGRLDRRAARCQDYGGSRDATTGSSSSAPASPGSAWPSG